MDTSLYAVTFVIVLLFSLFLMTLGGACLLASARAKVFLLGFATTAFTHYLEMVLRLIVGGSILIQAPHLTYSTAFTGFGWLMIGTAVGLLLLPWKLHRRFAEKAVPNALRFLPIFGVVSLALGIAISIFLISSRS